MADDQGERSEEATDAKREEFRKQGQVAHTKELSGALVFFAAAGMIWSVARFYFARIQEIFQKTLGDDLAVNVRHGNIIEMLSFTAGKSLYLILPIVCAAALIGVVSTVMQIGFLQVEGAMSPDLNRLNPISGFGRIFSLKGVVEGAKSIAKMLAVGFVLYILLKGQVGRIPQLIASSPEEILVFIGVVTAKLLFGVGMIMLALAGADYFFQRWELERKMMMTKQEIKEESKQREGDPQIKARIRRMQREAASRKMMSDVPKGSVVITNPTHIACVLRYSQETGVPQLIAKGGDLVAERIKAIAREHNIPIVENVPLARTIFKTMKLGEFIPRDLFTAVADVLKYIYQLKSRSRS